MKYATLFRILLFFSFLWPVRLYSQGDKALLRELAEENKKSVDALALYPSETRLAVLEASKYPEVLIKMNDTRLKTAAAFRNLIEDFPRTSQAIFYEITRYPGMLQQLADNSESPDFQQRILDQLPENQRADAWRLVHSNTRTLLKINEIDHSARDAFETVISGYPAPAKAAFRQLVELPEVLEILNEDLRFTVLVGDVYRADPAWVIHKTDSLNLAVAREHASELDEWKTALENDTQAQQELEAASKEYASEYGYDANAYYSDDDLYYQDRPAAPYTMVNYHYDWWFGYPWWYPAPYWQPYPWWYDWGFYHHTQFVVVYMPSWHFMHWYFDHPQHHHHYNHLSAHFVEHYYGHRRSGTSISVGVGNWHERNRTIISDEWMQDRGRLPERMKEYGKFEENLQDYNGRNPKTPVTPDVFLEKNGQKYPELKRSHTQATEARQRTTEPAKPAGWAPQKDPAPAIPKTEPRREDKTEPVQKPSAERPPRIQPTKPAETKEQPRIPRTDPPRTEPAKTPPVEKPNDYHRQQWEQTRRDEKPQERPRTTEPKVQPKPKATAPKSDAKTPAKKGRGN